MGEKMTRADAIRAMDDEALARYLAHDLEFCAQEKSCLVRFEHGYEPTDVDCARCVREFLAEDADE